VRDLLKNALASVAVAATLAACGNDSGSGNSSNSGLTPISNPVSSAVSGSPDSQTGASTPKAIAATALQRDALVLLIPDGADESHWSVRVWLDTAQDEGYRIQIITDSTFIGMGAAAAQKIKALILPDSAHIRASDPLIAALTSYANGGGNLLITYDAGVLTDSGLYAAGKSRLSALAGVNYALYDTLLDQVVGIGPVVGTKDRLTTFNFPPGKYVTYTGTLTGSPVLKGSTNSSMTARYLPVSPSDPGGLTRAEPFTKHRPGVVLSESKKVKRNDAARNAAVNSWLFQSGVPRIDNSSSLAEVRNDTNEQEPVRASATNSSAVSTKDVGTTLEKISGYAYNELIYYSFVTSGTYQGTAMLASPVHGVVSGWRVQGAGKVMFVNLPLGYFKALGTDSAPIHGSLAMFARNVASLPRLSSQPKGVGGMVYNWHVDDRDDLTGDAKWLLDNSNVFKRGPYSIHFTAGIDTAVAGDGLGMNLPNNPAAQDLVRRLGNLGSYAGKLPFNHALASHGGWNHDLYGDNVTETNQSTYEPWLVLNANAVESITGKPSTEYSAPQGNNPLWALRWLQGRGVKAYYYAGDIGSAGVRAYRDGAMRHPGMWAFPVTPQGIYATFEEFEDFGVSDATTLAWLKELQDFVVSKRTNRMFYNHPPGARDHLTGVVEPMLARAETLQAQGNFKWYTMTDLAVFLTRRNQVVWNVVSNSAGTSTFSASHDSDLSGVTVLVPKNRYKNLSVKTGSASIKSDTTDWVIVVNSGKSVSFTGTEL
jgi:hypothetical protein